MEKTRKAAFRAPRDWCRIDVLAASVCMNVLALAMPIVVLQVYDRILPNQSYDTLGVFVAVLLGVAVLDGLLNLARATILARCGAKFEYDMNIKAMDAVLKSDLSHFNADAEGVHLERFQGIEAIRDFYHGPSMLVVVELPFVALFMLLIWQFAGLMVLIPATMIGVFLLISYVAGHALRDTIAAKSEHHERRQNFVIECLQGIHTIKALALETQMVRRYERLQTNSASSIFNLARINSIVHGLAGTFSQAVMIAFVAIGSVFVVKSELSIGALAAGTMLAGRVLQPALRALSFWTYSQSIHDREEKLNSLLSLKPEAFAEQAQPIRIRGKLELKDVNFTFSGAKAPILKDVSLMLEPGESVSIRGPNGAGKSTLLNIIMGFCTPSSGQILLDDQDLFSLDRSTVRAQIGLIPQHGVLFNGTLLENMTLYREGQPVADAIRLTRQLHLDNTIMRLPDGLDTQANGDLSQSIPHGFAQRLVTVRALIGDLSIVIFDDANLGFDDRNDGYLRDLLLDLRKDHTLIVVSHRPSLQRICQRHYELVDGRLLAASGAFQAQARGDGAKNSLHAVPQPA